MLRRIVSIATLICCVIPAAGQEQSPARKYLMRATADSRGARFTLSVLSVLATTRDKDLLPVLAACSRSKDKNYRFFGTKALADIGGKKTTMLLSERLAKDSSPAVRSEALFALLQRKAVTVAQLREALKSDSDYIRCLAAVGLVRRNNPDQAASTLKQLTASRNASSANIARMCLLSMGRQDQLIPLRKLVRNPSTSDELLGRLLSQMTEHKIAAAFELAEWIANSKRSGPLRAQAYQAISALSPRASETLVLAISNSRDVVFRAHLLNVLSDRNDAGMHMLALSKGKGVIAALAAFELSRSRQNSQSSQAALKALSLGQPIVTRYLLMRTGEDIDRLGGKAGFYTPVLLSIIRSAEAKSDRMRREHLFAARAATLLGDLGTPAALKALEKLLEGKYNATLRAVAGGVQHTKNPKAAALLKPLLGRPYDELVVDAAMGLGKAGDPAAAKQLDQIVRHSDRHPPAVGVLASWYLLKLRGSAAGAAVELAKQIK